MPPLNWDIFRALPGDPSENFEMLCRTLVLRHYGRYGAFRSLAQQPGVEFHIKLFDQCPLGDPERWYGWQCRWYEIPSGHAIGSTRRRKIQDAIIKSEEVLPGLTDWVLWTRYPLTRRDQEWFGELDSTMRLHLWTGEDVESHLSGDAEIFRRTYFGDLVLSSSDLSVLHDASSAQIQERWLRDVYQTVDAEREVTKRLGDPDAWSELRNSIICLDSGCSESKDFLDELPASLRESVKELISLGESLSQVIGDVEIALDGGDLDHLTQLLSNQPGHPPKRLRSIPRHLRAIRHPSVFAVTNMLADIRSAIRLLANTRDHLDVRQLAVVAEYGCGKTYLSAQLTSPETNGRPAGILLHGRTLSASDNLNDLAESVVIQGQKVSSMDALLSALDAAGRRSRRRLPIVIDGLNESEDPRVWKGLLAYLGEMLRHYPYVLVITTVRPEFAVETLPEGVEQVEIPSFGSDTQEAIERYFHYYKIDHSDVELPLDLLAHPLFLRVFCEVTNPERQRVVGVEAIPSSLTDLFERYIQASADRISQLAPLSRRYYPQDVRTALDKIGIALWEEQVRYIPEQTLRDRLDDSTRLWHESLVQALEQGGILSRIIEIESSTPYVTVIHDALAGHLAASAILSMHGRDGFLNWLERPETASSLFGNPSEQHPLAEDIVRALVGLVPRKLYRQQLWQLLDEPMRTLALRATIQLEATFLDADSVDALAEIAVRDQKEHWALLRRIRHTRGSITHPLNSEFLDRVLRPLTVAGRDLLWTEWIRLNATEVLSDLDRLENRWRDSTYRDPSDRLCAEWLKWILTSTVHEVRDRATSVLYWYGRGSPGSLFKMTLESLSISDPYVYERLLAASYGVAMANQVWTQGFATAIRCYLEALRSNLTGRSATNPTNHILARLYAKRTFDFAGVFFQNELPSGISTGTELEFADDQSIEPIREDDPRADELNRTLHIHFRNYTLGRLFPGRRNYDMRHVGIQSAIAYVLGTVWELGWRQDRLGNIDDRIAGDRHWREVFHRTHLPTERYGKKYGWIAYHSYAGVADVDISWALHFDIDPSFPENPRPAPFDLPTWARPTPSNDARWIRRGIISIPDHVLHNESIGSGDGSWIAVSGFLTTDKNPYGRGAFGFLSALLVLPEDVDQTVQMLPLLKSSYNFDVPYAHDVFAGEIPWKTEFRTLEDDSMAESSYIRHINISGELSTEFELLSHTYNWQSCRSTVNQATEILVPSKAFSAFFNLRSVSQTLDQITDDGQVASKTLDAPQGFGGNILYLREDLLRRYANGRQLIWFWKGEREISPWREPAPRWLRNAHRDRAHIWHHVRVSTTV